ncbi:TetR/AcrR family transcriptional regulator [Pseudarcicella hirudinis]|nr:TetR/AcrR family transcriptional regulator [Pseudarcicella hirudinis]
MENLNVKIFSMLYFMRENIVSSSLQQFLIHGIRKMTIQQIIHPLGLSTKTVYKHFANKEALLEECLILHYSGMFLKMKDLEMNYSSPLLLLFQLHIKGIELDFKVNPVFYYDLNHYYPDLQDNVMRSGAQEAQHFMVNIIEKGKNQHYIRSEISTTVILETLGLLYRSLTRTNTFDKFNVSVFELAENTLGVYLRGICTEKGLIEINNHKNLTTFNENKT